MAEERERDEASEEQEDPGLVGGGGPASTIPEYAGPDEEEGHLADTDHAER